MDVVFFVLPVVAVALGYVLPSRSSRDAADPCHARPATCPMG